jgi:uncharacterized protein
MTDEVAEHLIATFLATPQREHSFVWQGGEPTLMGLDFFRRVTHWQQVHGRYGAVIANSLQTNATLLDDAWADHFARYRFLVGLSIDGPKDAHDESRRFGSGRGSHADVLKGLQCLRRNGVESNVLTLVSQANVHRPRDVYHHLRDQLGVVYQQYVECVEFDDRGSLRPFAITGSEWGDFLCGVYDEWQACGDHRRVSVRLFDSILTMLVDHQANACTMGRDCREYLVVEHNGDVYPCDFYVRKDLKLGNIMEESWDDLLSSESYAEFGARKRRWSEQCARCEFLEICAGCCPKNRPNQGRDPTQLSVLCHGWRQFFRHALPGFKRLADEVQCERRRRHASPITPVIGVPFGSVGNVGRNAPCPCGSGKKFKKCCGRG